MLFYAVLTVYVVVCLLLLVVVLLQQGKGGDIASAFGGASSQTAFGARAGATVLTRATTVLATLFILGAFLLTLMGRSGGGSVVQGMEGPAPEQAAPALPTLPVTPAPAPAEGAPAPAAPATGQPPAQQ